MESMEEQNRRRREKAEREAEERQRLHMQRLEAQQMRQQQQGQGPQGANGGVSPMMASQMMGGGEAAAGGSSGGGAAGGGMAAMAGPAALAAVIVANETAQRKAGNRPDDFGDQVVEGLTGEGLTRDIDRLTGDNELAGWVADHGNPKGLMKNMEKGLKPWEMIKDWF